MKSNMASLGKSLFDKEYTTYSDDSENENKATRVNTDSVVLPTIPIEDYKYKVKSLLNSYQIKSRELLKILDQADSNTKAKDEKIKKEKEEREKKLAAEAEKIAQAALMQTRKFAKKGSVLLGTGKSTVNNLVARVKTEKSEDDDENLETWKEQKYPGGIKVSADFGDYVTTADSLNVLNENKRIIEDILKFSKDRQKFKTEEEISKYIRIQKFNNKFLKVKISNVKPKIQDELKESVANNNAKQLTSELSIGRKTDNFLEIMKSTSNLVKLHGYYITPKMNFPEGREQFALKYDYIDCILFGGLTSNKNISTWTLDLEELIWKKRDPNIEYGNNQMVQSRYGHTGILYQKKFYIFGGKTKNNNFAGYGDLEIYNIPENRWTFPTVYTKSYLKLRRNHVAELIGNQMFVHGGISEEGEFLNDCHILNFHPIKWSKVSIKKENEEDKSPFLAGHSCCLVISDEFNNNKLNIYNIPLLKGGSKFSTRVKHSGLYFFGGKTLVGKDEVLTNDLHILSIGSKPLEWIRPETSGTPPTPRYLHSMNFFEEGNYLIIHGGRHDNSESEFAYNDFHILELAKMEWMQVKMKPAWYGTLVVHNRCGHCSIIHGSKLMILGGMNEKNYLGSTFFCVELKFWQERASKKKGPKDYKMMNDFIPKLEKKGSLVVGSTTASE